jgi:Recombination endonuclease VII
MDETNAEGTASSEAVPSRMCNKCGENPRAREGTTWCKPCLAAYQREYNQRTRPRERVETRQCAECGGDFEWHSTHARQKFCTKACFMKDRHRAKRERGDWRKPMSKETRRRADFKRRGYGITPEEFDALVEKQAGRCRICLREVDLVPDHCHDGGGFRGAICANCNIMLGHAKNDPETLRRAADYMAGSLSI